MSPHPPEESTPLEQRLAEMERRLTALSARLEAIERDKSASLPAAPSLEIADTDIISSEAESPAPFFDVLLEPPCDVPPPLPTQLLDSKKDRAKDKPAPQPAVPKQQPPREFKPSFANRDVISEAMGQGNRASQSSIDNLNPPMASPAPAMTSAPSASSAAESDWRDLLRRLRILPPERREGENLEMEIGRWWFSRIGILFAVAGAVFFAVYISQFTSPLQRLATLCAVSCGVVGLGWWLERKMPQFGAVVFAGGLALLYFASWASHAVSAVKIFDDPWPSLVWQFATVAGIVACGAWRQRPTVATMATLLGFATSFLAIADDRSQLALGAAALLGSAAAGFFLWRGWLRPLIVAIPLTYFIFSYAVFHKIDQTPWLTPPQAWSWLLGFMLFYGAMDAIALWRRIEIPGAARRVLFIFNSSAAVLIGYRFTDLFYPGQLDVFYFLFGGVLLAATLGYYFNRHRDVLMHAWFLKATGLITLGLIEVGDARTRWIALLVESAILLVSAWRSRLKTTEAAAGVVWLLSLGYFCHFAVSEYFPQGGALQSRDALLGLAWVVGSAVMLNLWGRFMPAWGLVESIGERPREINAFAGFALAIGVLTWVWAFLPRATWWPASTGALALGLAVIAIVCRHWTSLLAAGIVFAAANLRFWLNAPDSEMIEWGNAAALTALGLGSALAHGLWSQRRPKWNDSQSAAAIDALLNLTWMTSLHIVAFRVWPLEVYLFVMSILALAAAGLSRLAPLRRMALIAALPLVLALVGLIWRTSEDNPLNPANVNKLWLWGLIAGAWSFTVLQKLLPTPLKISANAHFLHIALAAIFTLMSLFVIFNPPEIMIVIGVAMLAMAALGRVIGLRPAFIAAVAYFVFVHLTAARFIRDLGSGVYSDIELLINILGTELMAIVFISMAAWWRGGNIWRRAGLDNQIPGDDRPNPNNDGVALALQWIGAPLILFTLFRLFFYIPGAWQHYISVCWGVSSIVVLAAGFLGRARPLRLAGIAALALTSGRVCLVDIQSMIYRIAAFIALGLVMLMVAFLYHRFSAIIAKWEGAGEK